MPSKFEDKPIVTVVDVLKARPEFEPQDEFERLRELLLEDALAQLRTLEGENRGMQREQSGLLERHALLAQEYQKLSQAHEQLDLKHHRLLDELAKLRLKIEDKGSFTATLEPVIADTLERKIASSGEEMAEVVAPLMAPAIKKQIHDSKDEMVEALHPIIGQTVKRAVAEAMRKLVREINQRLDRAFNVQGTWRRLKAKLTGVPESLAVLPQVLPFTVEEVFLIARKTGLLMAHVSVAAQTEAGAKAQMVSSMLTAIQDFIKDVHGEEKGSDVHEFKHGDRSTFVMASPMLFLAAATQGQPPEDFSEQVRRVLNKIQNTCYHAIVNFDGDTAELQNAQPPMRKFVQSFEATPGLPRKHEELGASPAAKIAWGTIGALALMLLAWFLFKPKNELVETPPMLEAAAATLAPSTTPFRLEARMNGEVWMRVFDNEHDSTTYKDFRFQPGEVYAWRAHGSMRMRVGNAGGLELYLDGINLGELGAVHQPVTLHISHEGVLIKKHSPLEGGQEGVLESKRN